MPASTGVRPSAGPRAPVAPATAARPERIDDGIRVRQFDAERRDLRLSLAQALMASPSERQLLWIDIGRSVTSEEATALASAFELDARTVRALVEPGDRPHLGIHGTFFHVRVGTEDGARTAAGPVWLDVIAGRNVVITRHSGGVAFLDDLDSRIEADTQAGLLDSTSFTASVLDGVLTTYFRAVDAIEDDIDQLDTRSLHDDGRTDLLTDLVAGRRRIARLRRRLSDHREVFAWLGSARVAEIVEGDDAVAGLHAVSERFDRAIGAVEAARDILLGSFDIYMTRTAQRTNEVMKVLALATVLLLPGSLVAGLLGMNVTIPLSKDDPAAFWVIVAGVGVLVLAVLGLARWRRWL